MKLVERVPFGGARDSVHDRICAAIVDAPEIVLGLFAWGEEGAEPPLIEGVDVEVPCGHGFADIVLMLYARHGFVPPHGVSPGFRTPVGECSFRMIIEVKSDAENASAGDVVRQLRWYQQRLACAPLLVCIAETLTDVQRKIFFEMEEMAFAEAFDLFPSMRTDVDIFCRDPHHRKPRDTRVPKDVDAFLEERGGRKQARR